MPSAAGSGTLIYAKDLTLLASFYRVLLSMSEVHASVRADRARDSRADRRDHRRRITNAYDPEGNIIQLREPIDDDRVAR